MMSFNRFLMKFKINMKRKFFRNSIGFLGLLVILQFTNAMLGNTLAPALGAWPQDMSHITGIATYSLVHGGWFHLIMNGIFLMIFGSYLEHFGQNTYAKLIILGGLGSGALIWFLGTPGIPHVGASGIGYAMMAYISFFVFIAPGDDPRLKSMKKNMAIMVGLNFLLTFMIPGISVLGHLGGFIVGLTLAVVDRQRRNVFRSA